MAAGDTQSGDGGDGGGGWSPPFSAYEYFGYIFPGIVVFAVCYLSAYGLPKSEPGATAVLAVVSVSFVAGHAVAAVATLIEPVFWGHLLGSRTDSSWGMFGGGAARYPTAERATVEADLEKRFGKHDFGTSFNLAYQALQQAGQDRQLKIMNQQIGFYRNMAASCLVSTGILAYLAYLGLGRLPSAVWAVFLLVALLFVYRYRRFWRYFGDYVIRGIRVLPPTAKAEVPPASATNRSRKGYLGWLLG